MDDRIHLSVPHMSGMEEKYVAEAFASNWLSSVGPSLDAFELEVAAYLGERVRTLAVSAGTSALHLVLRYIGIEPGDRVAVSTLTFAGSVWPILYEGGIPVFVDSETVSGNMDVELLREYLHDAAARNELPKALIVVHLYGQHADIDSICAACAEYGVVVIEDSAESLGATYRGRQTGTTADFAILSFNGNKMITTTGGGMVVTRDEVALARMKKWATQSREPAVEYLHREKGYNYRMSNVLASIGRGQLTVLGARVKARRAVADRYCRALSGIPGVIMQPEASWGLHSRWLSVIYLDEDVHGVRPGHVVQQLNNENIEVRPVWRPMHMQPVFAGAECVRGEVSEAMFASGLCLPSSSSLSAEQQDRVIGALSATLGATELLDASAVPAGTLIEPIVPRRSA